MFPYPSGSGLHVGHPRGYTASDVISRFKRMQGFNVLHPMGWDSFGLPAERAANRSKLHPLIITKRNIASFRGQIKMIGYSYAWNGELNTSSILVENCSSTNQEEQMTRQLGGACWLHSSRSNAFSVGNHLAQRSLNRSVVAACGKTVTLWTVTDQTSSNSL